MNNQFILTHPSFENVKQAAQHIVSQMDATGFRPEHIVALARGGAIIGVMLSHALTVPVTIVPYSSKHGKGDDRNHLNVLPKVCEHSLLVVDDLTDSGHSMKEVTDYYQNEVGLSNVKSATMYAKESGVIIPDYYWHWLPANSPFIHFPWETMQ